MIFKGFSVVLGYVLLCVLFVVVIVLVLVLVLVLRSVNWGGILWIWRCSGFD